MLVASGGGDGRGSRHGACTGRRLLWVHVKVGVMVVGVAQRGRVLVRQVRMTVMVVVVRMLLLVRALVVVRVRVVAGAVGLVVVLMKLVVRLVLVGVGVVLGRQMINARNLHLRSVAARNRKA